MSRPKLRGSYSHALGMFVLVDVSSMVTRKAWAQLRRHLPRDPDEVVLITARSLRKLIPRAASR